MSMSDPELDPKLADTRPGVRVRTRMPSPPDPPVRHRSLHPVETMSDVTLGLAVAAAATVVDRSSTGIGIALTLVALTYTLWSDAALVANRVSLRPRTVRWPLVVVTFAGIVLTVAAPGVLAGSGVVYAGAYWVARLALVRAVWARPEFGYGINPLTMPACFSGPLLAVGCVVDGDARLAIWVSAAIHDVAVGYVLRGRTGRTPTDPEHLADRSTIGVGAMVLGGAAILAGGVDAASAAWPWWLAVVAAAMLLGSLWWTYLAVLRPAQVFPSPDPDLARHLVSYAQLALAAGAVLVCGGVRFVLDNPRAGPDLWVSALVGTGLLLAYGGMAGVSSWLLGRLQGRLVMAAAASVALVALGAVVPVLPTLVVAALAAVGLAVTVRPRLPRPEPDAVG